MRWRSDVIRSLTVLHGGLSPRVACRSRRQVRSSRTVVPEVRESPLPSCEHITDPNEISLNARLSSEDSQTCRNQIQVLCLLSITHSPAPLQRTHDIWASELAICIHSLLTCVPPAGLKGNRVPDPQSLKTHQHLPILLLTPTALYHFIHGCEDCEPQSFTVEAISLS